MIRATIILILVTTLCGKAQDSLFVAEFCKTLKQPRGSIDVESKMGELTEEYYARDSTTFHELKDLHRFQYKLSKELMKNCPGVPVKSIRLWPSLVFDLENIFTTNQIDSLKMLTKKLNDEKNIYLYIVTIDDFYPDTSISEFSNRYREYWAPRKVAEKGVVTIFFSKAQREIRISTGDLSMTYLTDDECSRAIQIMTPHFKSGNYANGMEAGLLAIGRML